MEEVQVVPAPSAGPAAAAVGRAQQPVVPDVDIVYKDITYKLLLDDAEVRGVCASVCECVA